MNIELADLRDAQLWINVMHRRTCEDARRISNLETRVRELEAALPWWRRRRTQRRQLEKRTESGDGYLNTTTEEIGSPW